MKMLSMRRPRPSIEIVTPTSLSAPVKSRLVNWLPPVQAGGGLWSVLNISGVAYWASASFGASTQKEASMVFDNRQDRT